VAVVSLVVWISIIFLGRWVGFSTTKNEVKTDTDINIDALFPQEVDGAAPAKPPR
jgi:hypothetical protein